MRKTIKYLGWILTSEESEYQKVVHIAMNLKGGKVEKIKSKSWSFENIKKIDQSLSQSNK